jgi:hypothetical protein
MAMKCVVQIVEPPMTPPHAGIEPHGQDGAKNTDESCKRQQTVVMICGDAGKNLDHETPVLNVGAMCHARTKRS